MAFSYQLTKPAAVTVEIRNISGVLIKRFAEQMADANATQTVLWNGLSDRGTKVPAGRYLSRITARAEDGQAVQAIRPFMLTP
jgi:flagellar hook assembly protein FlgD